MATQTSKSQTSTRLAGQPVPSSATSVECKSNSSSRGKSESENASMHAAETMETKEPEKADVSNLESLCVPRQDTGEKADVDESIDSRKNSDVTDSVPSKPE